MRKAIIGTILAVATMAHGEDWFSYSAKHFWDHKIYHIAVEYTVGFGSQAVINTVPAYHQDPGLPIFFCAGLGAMKEVGDLADGEKLSYALGDFFIWDAIPATLGILSADLAVNPRPEGVEVSWRF